MVDQNEEWRGGSPHGNYSWAPDSFRFNHANIKNAGTPKGGRNPPGVGDIEEMR